MKNLSVLAACGLLTVAAATAFAQLRVPERPVSTNLPAKAIKSETSNLIRPLTLKKGSTGNIAAHHSNVMKEESEWTNIGSGYFTDVFLSGFFGSQVPQSQIPVEFEQNNADPTIYRIPNPYANWENPFTNVTYSDDPTNYMTIHIINDQFVYIDDFSTGIEFVDEDVTLTKEGDDFFIKILSQAAGMIEYNGLDAVLQYLPDIFGTINDGVISFRIPQFSLDGSNYYSFLTSWGDTSNGYYAANTNGEFQIILPGAEIKETVWEEAGQVLYTDDLIASLFEDINPETLEVTLEVDAENPNHYRIADPYANYMNDEFDHTGNGLIEYEVYDDSYVYFTSLKTGLSYNGTELNAKMNIDATVNAYGVEAAYESFPDAFGVFNNGIVTVPVSFRYDGSNYPVMLVSYQGLNYNANKSGLFRIEPVSELPDDPYTWQPYGTGTYTDDFLASYIPDVEISTFEVEIQQDTEDQNHFRIVNPYANWQNDTYSATAPGVAEFYIYDGAYAYFTKFITGVRYQGQILEVKQNIMSALSNGLTLETAVELFPESLCKYEDGVLTATTTFDNGGSPFSVFQIPEDDFLHRVNLDGAFRLEMPTDVQTWTSFGTANYTDDFLASYIPGVEISTFQVEIQQDAEDENHFRILNPYANWPNEFYHAAEPAVAEFYIYNNSYAYFTKFETGVTYQGQKLEVIQNIMSALNNGLTLETAIELFPESLCKYENGVMTATETFDNGGTPFSVFQIPEGNILHRVNLQGAFRLELLPVSVDKISADDSDDSATEYYNLQGLKVTNPTNGIYIRKSGNTTRKVKF